MFFHILLFVTVGFSISQCMDIDLLSMRVIPKLRRLCWKQFDDKHPSTIEGYDGQSKPHRFVVFKDPLNLYCIEKKNDSTTYRIHIPVVKQSKSIVIVVGVNFQLLLASPMPAIRKKEVPNGVHFQLHPTFANIPKEKIISCEIVLMYGLNKKNDLTKFSMRFDQNPYYFQQMSPGTEFNLYYSCNIPDSNNISSQFVRDQGIVYLIEKTHPLQPFLQMPFRRFLVGSLNNPAYIPRSYKIVIYGISNLIESCLKIFRMYSSSAIDNRLDPQTKNCDHKVTVEDIGTFQSNANDEIHFVLDMVEPLMINMRYKLSILWMSPTNELEENFIYFEPLPNQNIGYISLRNKNNYTSSRNAFTYMLHDVINQYARNFTVSQWPSFSSISRLILYPSVAKMVSYIDKNLNSKITYNFLNELEMSLCSRISNSSTQKYEAVPLCANGTYPFFYLIELTESNKNTKAELFSISRRESPRPTNVTLTHISRTYQFKISWTINRVPITKVPSWFVVQLKLASTDECMSMYVVGCRTCNKMHKGRSELTAKVQLAKWKENCKTNESLQDYYEAMDYSKSIISREMTSMGNFIAEVYSINLFDSYYLGRSSPTDMPESFWIKYGLILASVFCSFIVVFLILFGLRYKSITKGSTVYEISESNKYMSEDQM